VKRSERALLYFGTAMLAVAVTIFSGLLLFGNLETSDRVVVSLELMLAPLLAAFVWSKVWEPRTPTMGA
jgi:hypothetical protein